MIKRQTYLSMKGLDEAKRLFFSRIDIKGMREEEDIASEEALGRVTARPVFARISSPSYHSAAMDGIAVKAEDTYGVTERRPKVLRIGEHAIWVNTGDPMPSGYNAVIMVEKINQIDDLHVEIIEAAYPWQNVRKVGEDIVATELLFPQNHRLRAYDLGVLISAGIWEVRVWKKPNIVIIPTGSELISHKDVHDRIEEGRIIEFNSITLSSLVKEAGGIPVVYDIVPDDQSKIRAAIERALDSDARMVIINAGSSAGTRDYVVHILNEMGEVLVHGVNIMPGKPTILAIVRGKPVIGNPGYPVSSIISFEQFAMPVICQLQGDRPPERRKIKVIPSRDVPSRPGMEEFIRVNIGKIRDRYVATPLPRGAGVLTTLIRAEGIIRVDPLSEGISQDDEIESELLVEERELEDTVVVIGSHDMCIDIIADEARKRSNTRLSLGNVGSLGGLIALRKGISHMAGSHLLDPETGEYNISYVKRYLKGMKVHIYNLVLREQGFMVKKGNPKKIEGIEDLVRRDIRFVNRQAGSGTRVLLDYILKKQGIDPGEIRGYEHEEFTHMAVAVDVLSGVADCGIGIFAAAKAIDLDFIPIGKEQYDLIIPSEFLNDKKIKEILEIIKSPQFKRRVQELGGYDPRNSGRLFFTLQ